MTQTPHQDSVLLIIQHYFASYILSLSCNFDFKFSEITMFGYVQYNKK